MTLTRVSSVVFCRHSVPFSCGEPLVPPALLRQSRLAVVPGHAPMAQVLPNWYMLAALLIVNVSIGLADAAEANAVDATAAVTTAAAILNCLSMMLLWWGFLSWE